jgi:hypothetical protein
MPHLVLNLLEELLSNENSRSFILALKDKKTISSYLKIAIKTAYDKQRKKVKIKKKNSSR